MAALVDVCRFNPTLGGTTDWVYSSAVTGYQGPVAAGAVNGLIYSYRAESADLSQWEVGYGAYTSGTTTFARTAVLFNSSGTTSKINFSTAPQVAIVALAEDVVNYTGSKVGIGNTAPDGVLHVGSAAAASSLSNIVSARANTGSANVHGIVENSTYNLGAAALGVADFDALATYTGTQTYDHHIAFQSRPVYGSSGTITNFYGFGDFTQVNAGTATNHYQHYASNPSGAGTITNAYGFYAESITKGGTLNYAFFSAGTTPSKFGGNVTAASLTAIGSGATGVGYGTGAGGAVTQATSKSTGVTLNTPCGQITLNSASLAASSRVNFTLTNSAIAATDVVAVSASSGVVTSGNYTIGVDAVAAGSCRIFLLNNTSGALAEAVVLNFAVLKAVAS